MFFCSASCSTWSGSSSDLAWEHWLFMLFCLAMFSPGLYIILLLSFCMFLIVGLFPISCIHAAVLSFKGRSLIFLGSLLFPGCPLASRCAASVASQASMFIEFWWCQRLVIFYCVCYYTAFVTTLFVLHCLLLHCLPHCLFFLYYLLYIATLFAGLFITLSSVYHIALCLSIFVGLLFLRLLLLLCFLSAHDTFIWGGGDLLLGCYVVV